MNRLDSLDRELERWKTAVGMGLADILDLYEHPTYRRLAGKVAGTKVVLTGKSAAPVEAAVASVGYLLILCSNLGETIDRAAELRATMPLLFQTERIAEIARLLQGEAVALPATDATDLRTQKVTPEIALQMLQTSLALARDTILEVHRAWTDFPVNLEVVLVEVAAIERFAGSPGLLDEPRLTLQRAQTAVLVDPLGALESLQGVVQRLAQIRGEVEAENQEWMAAKQELQLARELARELLETHAQAAAANTDCLQKIQLDTTRAELLDESTFSALGEWLDRLAQPIESRAEWSSARIGLGHWHTQASTALASDRAALLAAETLLQERLSLRGLLEALQAKATACSLAEDAELAKIGSAARKLLYIRPTPLREARERVADFQSLLHARLKQP